MSTRVVEHVDDWSERPFSDGYRGLQDLAESGFSGVVRAGGAELYMTRGAVVGIQRGDIEDFEGSSGTVYEAPTDALPLLALMQERSDEVRAKYYSEDTSISEVDRTLESGGFTGFVELSENVLSGDYYLVYHQGTSMAVAYVGNSGQLLTDDEAFERADDEVGIYEVRPVDIEPIEIPEPPEPEPEPEPDPEPEPAPVASDASDDQTDTDEDPLGANEADSAESADTVVDPDPEETEVHEDDVGADGPVQATESGSADDTATTVDRSEASPLGAVSDDETGTNRETEIETEAETEAKTETADQTTETPPLDADDDEPAVTDGRSAGTESETPRTEPTERESGTGTRTSAETTDSPTPETGSQASEPATAATETDTGTTAERTAAERAAATQTELASSRASDSPETTPSDPADQTQQDAQPTRSRSEQTEAVVSAVEEEESSTEDPSSLETRAIPSLDPERTSSRARSSASEPRRDAPGRGDESQTNTGEVGTQSTGRREQATSRAEQSTSRQRQQTATDEVTSTGTQREQTTASTQGTPESAAGEDTTEPEDSSRGSEEVVSERIDELQELLGEREKEINRLESSLETAQSERDSARQKLAQLREERDELQERVESLESELRRLEEELGAATDAQQRMTPQEALSGTDIFVRYRSKGDGTLEKAHQSGAVKKDVVENLRLEKHTQFDADISAVGGREYNEFLEDTVAYRFVRWVVEDLIFEIQGTGHTESLNELYDALPKINRVELNGAVNVTYTEDGQETQATESFDVVFRERMGDPLLVANINESRQGASQGMMEDLITAAERVGQTSDQFASAFLVTESFFEPEALETVAEATRGGILSRDKRKSFVNLSRKRGYHLCLVEARNQNFHLEVPEL